jgi:AraC-like DNA-binding protein
MDYQIYTPSAELGSFVKCFWSLEDTTASAPVRQRVVPDGCMEMIFNYGDLYQQFFEDGTSLIQPRSFIFGQISRFIEIAPTGNTGIIAARFFPGGLSPFIDLPVSLLENKAVDIQALFGEKGKLLEQEVLSAATNTGRISLLERFLLSRLGESHAIDMITKECVDVIMQSNGQLDVAELAEKMQLHRRNIERKFSSAIGMSPKQLARIVRLQSTLKMLQQKNFTSLTSLAYENGYYDQAHFIKDFKEFTGTSPKSFYAGNLQLASLFATAE